MGVEFKIVVFQPAVGEWLVGSITGSCKEGLRVSLSFFQDVLIPSSNLKTPFLFDAAEQCWVWQWRNQETNEVINFFYEQNALIRFRVIAVEFPEASGPQDKAREAAMKIVGAVDRDGLGCVSWWPEGIPFNNAAPQSLTALLSTGGPTGKRPCGYTCVNCFRAHASRLPTWCMLMRTLLLQGDSIGSPNLVRAGDVSTASRHNAGIVVCCWGLWR